MTSAVALLRAIESGEGVPAARAALATAVLADPLVALAQAVAAGGPFANRQAIELADQVLARAAGAGEAGEGARDAG